MTSERIASSLARPPALRMTWASPSARPAYLAGSRRASMQVRIAKRRAGGRARSAFAPKDIAYAALAARTSSRTWDIGLHSKGVGNGTTGGLSGVAGRPPRPIGFWDDRHSEANE